MRFVFLFLMLIVLEIWSIIKVGQQIGVLATLVLLVAGFIFGSQLMRAQGIASLMQSAQQAQAGKSPLNAVAGGLITAIAGILLIIPGFISDLIAIILLLPFVRNALVKRMLGKGNLMGFSMGGFGSAGFGMGGFKRGANDDVMGGNVYEHDGPANSSRDVKERNFIEQKDEAVDAEIIEEKSNKK